MLGNTFQAVFQTPINSSNLSGNTLQAKLFRLSFRCLSAISGTRKLADQELAPRQLTSSQTRYPILCCFPFLTSKTRLSLCPCFCFLGFWVLAFSFLAITQSCVRSSCNNIRSACCMWLRCVCEQNLGSLLIVDTANVKSFVWSNPPTLLSASGTRTAVKPAASHICGSEPCWVTQLLLSVIQGGREAKKHAYACNTPVLLFWQQMSGHAV